ncbi:ABC transporter ATP-binding protein [Haloferula sp. BvORR071]|uniref:ABC transporter ATP-binding protein n=1 Tax=Haloferula sp. BvORR071 TaxID=1396141 RepID=UPI0005518F1F|nr:ABC transporter ATP-binding protein [Haloferula sp. BvORR071]
MITIRGLKKRFRGNEALHGIDLDIPQGKVTAFLGPNGAGKTTTIKCAMNLIERDEGSVQVLGTDARKLGPPQWQRIGYVSENQKMPGWMTVPQLLDYLRPMYGGHWDRDFERKLLADFELPMKTKLRSLSRGQFMKAALVSSLAYRPQLVVLDEPFSGLDPLVREEFLSGLLELTETEGWTVWVSSHDVEEVERFADRVAIVDSGRVDLAEDVESIQARFRGVELVLDNEAKEPRGLPATWLNFQTSGRNARFTDSNYEESSNEKIRAFFPDLVRHEVRPLNLREVFVALAKNYRSQRSQGS